MDLQENTDNPSIDDTENDANLSQTKRRRLRSEYRNLILKTEQERETRLHFPSSSADDTNVSAENVTFVTETLGRSKELFKHVRTAREAALDSKLLVMTSELAAEQAQRMKSSYGSLDVDIFMDRLERFLESPFSERVASPVETDEQHGMGAPATLNPVVGTNFDWRALGVLAMRYMQVTPTFLIINGPMMAFDAEIASPMAKTNGDQVDGEESSSHQQAILAGLLADQTAQQLTNADIESHENETSRNVEIVYKCLSKQKNAVDFFKFVIHPSSFSQTIENIFYLSFLIRDGKVLLEMDPNSGVFQLSMVDRPSTAQQVGVGRPRDHTQSRYQLIVDLEIGDWKALCDFYHLHGQDPMIPDRSPSGP
jgi:non-structural maintenance of chromosomes element 4